MMKVDLSKPIRRIDDGGAANYLRDTPDGKHVIEWQYRDGSWAVDALQTQALKLRFENIPPAPRKCKTWVVWDYGSIGPFPVGAATVQIFKDAGARVTEHEIEEPTP